MTDQKNEGQFEWIDGILNSSRYNQWEPDEPNDQGQDEDCASIVQLEGWNDRNCRALTGSICESKWTSSVAEWLWRSLRVWEAGGSIPGRGKPNISN